MGHDLNTFIGRPEVLERLAPSIWGLRLVELPQGFALAPLPEALGNAVTLDHGPAESAMDLEHDMGAPGLSPELAAIAAAASVAGPVGWLKSDWFGGNGGNTVALWRAGAAVEVRHASEMLGALGVERALKDPDPDWVTRLSNRLLGEKPPTYDLWDSLGLGGQRKTPTVWARGQPVLDTRVRPHQEAMLRQVAERMGTIPRPASEAEPCRVRDAYLFETLSVPVQIGDRFAWVFVARHDRGLGAFLPIDPTECEMGEHAEIVLEQHEEQRLRAHGWRPRWGRWDALWPDVDRAVEGLMALTAAP